MTERRFSHLAIRPDQEKCSISFGKSGTNTTDFAKIVHLMGFHWEILEIVCLGSFLCMSENLRGGCHGPHLRHEAAQFGVSK